MTAFCSTLIQRTAADAGRECVKDSVDELAELEDAATDLPRFNRNKRSTGCEAQLA